MLAQYKIISLQLIKKIDILEDIYLFIKFLIPFRTSYVGSINQPNPTETKHLYRSASVCLSGCDPDRNPVSAHRVPHPPAAATRSVLSGPVSLLQRRLIILLSLDEPK